MNIIKVPYDQFEKAIIEVQKEFGVSKCNTQEQNDIAMLKLQRPENFIFNSYTIKFDNGSEYRVNRNENTFKHFLAGIESLSFTATRDEKGIIRPENISGAIPKLLANNRMSDKEKLDKIGDGIMGVVIPVICFEYRIMKLMESRNVTITDLSDIQKVTKVNKPQPKKNKKKSSRVSKEITLNFSDIEKVVYAKPEVHVPRSYERHTESWEVRGYVRHYKSGKTVFVKPYTKGKKTEKPSEDKVYNVKI